jgi:hypothetical protein
MNKSIFCILVFSIIVILQDQKTSAACCGCGSGKCGDCTGCTPCCGFGSCNLFCCSCSCRPGNCRRDVESIFLRNVHAVITDEKEAAREATFRLVDLDENGRLTQDEVDQFALTKYPKATDPSSMYSFDDLDTDHNGFLTIDEMDPSN